MKKFIKSMLLLFVAATVTHTPAFGQLSYSLPPVEKQLSRSVQPQETKKVKPTYSLPNYEMKNNSVFPQEETVSTENQVAKIEKQEEEKVVRKGPDIVFKSPSTLAFPKVPYPTMAIGQFINFCSNAMMQKFQQGAAQGRRIHPQMAAVSTQFVCSCIMDNYRKNNEYAEYQYEFTRGTAKDVPLFTKYMRECSLMNQQNMTRYMAAPTIVIPQFPANNPQKMN